MKKRIVKHISLWTIIALILVVYYGRVNGNFSEAFFFVTMLMPVAVGTAYVFNYYLVPNYLITKRYWIFTLYMFYMFVFTLYLEMMVIVFSFIFLYDFQYGKMNPLTVDTISVAANIYLIVFGFAFFRMLESLRKSVAEKSVLNESIEKNKQKVLTVISDRQQIPIPLDQIKFIESLSDYVSIDHENGKTITKEKISKLEEKLPANFLRVHRSFIINRNWISAFNSEQLAIADAKIPISRKYKKRVMEELG